MKRMLCLGHRCGLSSRRLSQLTTESHSSKVEPAIVIPKRIPRGPTDILRALESTIHTDHTAPEYKYIDDPFLIPAFNLEKRAFALAKENGIQAARYMLENYPECFKNDPAEPSIALFNPRRRPFWANEENSEEDLLLCIDELDVGQALIVYDNMKNQGAEISQETLLKLLELVSFHNGAPPPPHVSLTEARYFARDAPARSCSWRAGGVAEKIFEKIENKGAEAYSALISGMLKHLDVDRALPLYEEMRSKNLVPSVHVYNHLIRTSRRFKENAETLTSFVLNLFKEMRDLGVRPDVLTFSNALYAVSRFGLDAQFCSKILGEMKFLNIEPSLGTYLSVLNVLYKKWGVVHVMDEIMDAVAGRTWEVREPADFLFLTKAMQCAKEHEKDKDLGYRVLEMADRNPHLMNNSMQHSTFFKNYLSLLCETEDIDKFMAEYQRLVPNTYAPEPALMSEIMEAIKLARAYRYLPQIWSDLVLMRLHDRGDLLKEMLSLTAEVGRGTTKESEQVQQQCVVITRDAQTRLKDLNEERDRTFRLPVVVDADMISAMLRTYLNGNNLEYATDTFEFLMKNQKLTPGVLSAETLMLVAKKACEARAKPLALACVKYSIETGHDTIMTFVKEKAVELDFGEDFLSQLDGLEG